MKPSEILLRAAQIVEQSDFIEYGCHVLVNVQGIPWHREEEVRNTEAYKYYARVGPIRIVPDVSWFSETDRGPRIIALCLAAAIAQSDGK